MYVTAILRGWLRASLLMLLLACSGCAGDVFVLGGDGAASIAGPGGANAGPPLTTPTAPATLNAVLPAVVQAGSGDTVVTLLGTGIGVDAVVLMDGASHEARLVSSTAATVTLREGELGTGTRHSFAMQNAGFAASSTKPLLVTSGYWAFGDSITFGAGLADPAKGNYAYRLAAAYRLKLVNSARSGDQACDVWRQIYQSRAGYSRVAAPLYSLTIGTNDVDVKGPGAYESVFTDCDLAALAWLGTPRASKLLAGDAALTTAGGCVNAANADDLGAIACTGGSGTVTATLTTDGNPVYVWYLLSDDASLSNSVAVTLDGNSVGVFATRPDVPVATQNGTTQGVAVARFSAPGGLHTVRVETNGSAAVLGIGSNPVSGADRPRLLVGDLPNQAKDNPVAPVASQLAYLVHILDVEQLLLADGIDVHRALTRSYMQGTVFEMEDQLHPNVVGQAELEVAFNAALP